MGRESVEETCTAVREDGECGSIAGCDGGGTGSARGRSGSGGGRRGGKSSSAGESDALARDGDCAEGADGADGADDTDGTDDTGGTDEDIASMDTKTLGRKGEDAACRYLEAQGYDILERNWTCRFGEADVIAMDGDGTLAFIEVKTRRSVAAGVPEAAVTLEKQRRYEKIALSYLMGSDFGDGLVVRFDCIGICVTANRRALLRHHKGCFDGLF